MSRAKRIADSMKEISEGIKEINANAREIDAGYSMSRINHFELRIINEKVDDLSDRLKLIEAALGLIAEHSKKAS